MKRLLIAAVALALSACTANVPDLPPTPNTVAEATILDEQAALGVELAYQAAALATVTAARADLIPAAQRPRVAELDRRAYGAVRRVRAIYDAGNAASYGPAITEARRAIGELLALARPAG